MQERPLRLIVFSALFIAVSVHAQDKRKCNAPAAECERAIRQMASGRRYLGAQLDETSTGLHVLTILMDSPAQRGGLGEGDRLMSMNGHELTHADIKDFKRIVSDAKETGWLSIIVARNGILKKVMVRLEPYTKAQIDKMVAQHLAEAHSQAATTQPQP